VAAWYLYHNVLLSTEQVHPIEVRYGSIESVNEAKAVLPVTYGESKVNSIAPQIVSLMTFADKSGFVVTV
jgi:hypothetical protein